MSKQKTIEKKDPEPKSPEALVIYNGLTYRCEVGQGVGFLNVGDYTTFKSVAAVPVVASCGKLNFTPRIFGGIGTWANREAHTANMSAVGFREGALKMAAHIKDITASELFFKELEPLQDLLKDKAQSEVDKVQRYSDVLSYIVDSKEEEMDDMIRSVSRFAK
jgi:hypothetical protein